MGHTPAQTPRLRSRSRSGKGKRSSSTQMARVRRQVGQQARRERGNTVRPFPSTREMARRLEVNQTVIVRAYRELEKEGVLFRVRGSGTFLRPLKVRPRIPTRGVVGLPVWQYGYCNRAEWREFYGCLETHLRHRHFVADLIFYSFADPDLPEFTERLCAHEPDYLLWFRPLVNNIPTLQAVQEQGAGVAVVTDRHYRFPFTEYMMCPERPLTTLLKRWTTQGIHRVLVIHAGHSGLRVQTDFVPLGPKLGLEIIPFEDRKLPQIEEVLTLRGTDRTGLIFYDYDELQKHSHTQDGLMQRLMKRCRCMTLNRLDFAPSVLGSHRIDTLIHDWNGFARQVADDIASGLFHQKRPVQMIMPRARCNVVAASLGITF